MTSFPLEIQDLDEETQREISKDFPEPFVRVGKEKYLLPKKYEKFARKYLDFELRKEDVFIAGFPRSGTTLLQELVWLLCNNLDLERGKQLDRNQRVYNFEVDIVVQSDPKTMPTVPKLDNRDTTRKYLLFDDFSQAANPRIFKTHLPLSLLPKQILIKGCKMFYIARNPKDLIVSLYHFLQRINYRKSVESDFDTFVNVLMENKLRFTPYWRNLNEFWQQRNSPNLYFLFYEDLIKDLRGEISKIANFLEKPLTPENLDLLVQNLSFENFKKYFKEGEGVMKKKNDGNDGHVRKGKFGESQEYFQGELKSKIDKWISENVNNTGITFTYLD